MSSRPYVEPPIVDNTLYITVRGDRCIVYVPLSERPAKP